MGIMNISSPAPLKNFVDAQVTGGRYSSLSEYLLELIRADEKRKAKEWLRQRSFEAGRASRSQ